MRLNHLINNLNNKINEAAEIKETICCLEEITEETVDYLIELDPKFRKNGQKQIDQEIEEAYLKLENAKEKEGYYKAEKEVRKAENELLNYFFNNLDKMNLSKEVIKDYNQNRNYIMNNVCKREQLIYALL